MSYWEDLDDHLRRLEPIDLNLDYMGVSHLDCVSWVLLKELELEQIDFYELFKKENPPRSD